MITSQFHLVVKLNGEAKDYSCRCCGVERTPHCCLNFDFQDFDVRRLDPFEVNNSSIWRRNI